MKKPPRFEGKLKTPLTVAWHKTRWRCREPMCARLTFTEVIEEVPAGRRTTGRLQRAIACAVGDACRSVAEAAEAAEAFGVSWPTAHATVIDGIVGGVGVVAQAVGHP